jgi:hypothetical protein
LLDGTQKWLNFTEPLSIGGAPRMDDCFFIRHPSKHPRWTYSSVLSLEYPHTTCKSNASKGCSVPQLRSSLICQFWS